MDVNDTVEKTQGLSLRPTLVTAVVCIILLASGIIGTFAYFQSREIINSLWKDLAALIAQTTTEKTLGFLRPAVPFLSFSAEIEQSQFFTKLDSTEPTDLLIYCQAAIKTNPDLAWLSYADKNGTYVGAFRSTDDPAIIMTWRTIEGYKSNQEPITRIRNYHLQPDRTLELISESVASYDPRTRPYWRTGMLNPSGGWTDPFAFYTDHQPGIAYVHPQYQTAEISGMWVAEFNLSTLSDYLAVLRKDYKGTIALMTHQGQLIATSEGVPPIRSTDEKDNILFSGEQLFYSKKPINTIKQAWKTANQSGFQTELFSFGPYLAAISQMPESSKIPWEVFVLIPEEELFQPVMQQVRRDLIIAASLCLFFMIVAAIFFGHISKRLKEIAYEMQMIKNFQFTDRLFSQEDSLVREINMMNHATDSMKIGVQSFSKYVPIQLVKDLMTSGHAATLGGKKEEITILFTDLANFTSLAEKIQPKLLLELLEQYFGAMSDVVYNHEGSVDKFIGDSIMSIWGAPRPLLNHPEHACRAALAMKERLAQLWIQWESEGKPLLHQRIGVNTGFAIVGNIGSPSRMDYTAIGDHVNLASRLEGLNKIYGTCILIGETTAKSVEGKLLVRPIDWVAVKGRTEGVLIYELIGHLGQEAAAFKEALSLYSEALYKYKNRDFTLAADLFKKANILFGGNDIPSKLLLERSLQYELVPPPENWGGYTVMKEK